MKRFILRFSALFAITIGLSLQLLVLSPQPAYAEQCEPRGSVLGIPTWFKYLDGETDSFGRCNPTISNTRAALPIGIALLEAGLRLAGLVAVGMIILGASKFITSQGNPDNAAAARKTIINALIGLGIVILSTGIVSYIGTTIST